MLAVMLTIAVGVSTAAATSINRVQVWGGQGSADGKLNFPSFDAVDNHGHLYVSDEQNSRVVKFSDTGQFLLTWGWGVKTGTPRLETCTQDCRKGIAGTGTGQFDVPGGIAFDSNRVYVTDPRNDRIEVFTPTGRFLNAWGHSGSANGEFNAPIGVATDPTGRVYIADTVNSRIQKFSAAGKFLGKWSGPGTGTHNLLHPRGLTTDTEGHVYVSDTDNNRVSKFTITGKFLRMWGWGVKTGLSRFEICISRCLPGRSDFGADGPGRLDFPQGIATDSHGDVYVADAVDDRIEAFRPSGAVSAVFDIGTAYGAPQGVAIDRSNYLYGIYSRGKVVKARIH